MPLFPIRMPQIMAPLASAILLASCSPATPPGLPIVGASSSTPSQAPISIPTEDFRSPGRPTELPINEGVNSHNASEFALYSAGYYGLWVIGPSLDASRLGPSIYVMDTYDSAEDLSRPVPGIFSPSGEFVATYSADESEQWCLTLRIVVFHVSTGEIVSSIPVTPDALGNSTNADQECHTLEERLQYLHPIRPPASMAWSPEGETLAFVSAQDGPTADIYVADIAAGTTQRITTGPTQAAAPIWSPDGAFVVNSSIVDLSGIHDLGGPFPIWGPVYATEVSTATSRPLYYPSQSQNNPEAFLAWTSSRDYLADSQNAPCGYSDLRSVDILSGESHVLWTSQYEARAYAPEIDSILLSVPEQDPTSGYCQYDQEPGLYLMNLTTRFAKLISPEASDSAWWGSATWVPSIHRFVVSSPRGVITVAPEGTAIPIGPREASDLFIAPSGTVLAITPIYSPGLLVFTPEGDQIAATDLRAYALKWSSTGQSLAFFVDDVLHIAHAPYFTPTQYTPSDWRLRPRPGDEVTWFVYH